MEVKVHTVFQVDGVGADGAFCAIGAHFCHDAAIYGAWEHETAIVVGVLANQVDTASRGIDHGISAETLLENLLNLLFHVT